MEQIVAELDVICLIRFGSHLYGTDTPESDVDYKGIFMPTKEQILLGNVPKSMRYDSNNTNEKNSKDDVDAEMYSLHYFIELACKGETAALDMLHVNAENQLIGSELWTEIKRLRSRFYTKNLKAFVGYARKQAAKYGLKGTRLSAAEKILTVLDSYPGHKKLRDTNIFQHLPMDEHCFMLGKEHGVSFPTYQWCGKQVQCTVRVDYFREMVVQFIDTFGARAKKAQANEGIDWKAMSHALRAAYEVEEILVNHNIVFPLVSAPYLKAVKAGQLDFTNEVMPALESAMDRVEELSEASTLPNKVDRAYWNRFIISALLKGIDWNED